MGKRLAAAGTTPRCGRSLRCSNRSGTALRIPGGGGGDVLDRCGEALAATESLVLASGILNIWRHDPVAVAAQTAELSSTSGGRFLLGLGVSHEAMLGEEYVAPLAKMRSYLDEFP